MCNNIYVTDVINFAILIIALVFFFGTPIILTVINIIKFIECMTEKAIIRGKWARRFNNNDIWTICIGIVFNYILWHLLEFKNFTEPLVTSQEIYAHSPIQESHILSIVSMLMLGYVSYITLRIKKLSLPPLVSVIALAFIFITNYIGIILIIQLSKNLFTIEGFTLDHINPIFYMLLLPINFIVCSISLIRKLNNKYLTDESNKEYKSKLLYRSNLIVRKSNNWTSLAFILSLPLLVVLVMILQLFGQQPDSIIKAFTETSDWTLSQKISPPPVEYDGHYLCTVSLRGHRKIVKPIRYGLRRGNKIVVNRQLMIANAFEEVIQEKIPNIHKFIRYIYDKYGFPLSKLITTKITADIVYVLMKPLEYVFLIVLYTVDIAPECRIQKQYLPLSRK